MKKTNYKELEKFISNSRLKSYEQIIKKKKLENLIAAYHWNKQVSTSLYPILQCLEITLRNALHIAGSKAFQASDWYEQVLKHGGDEKFKSDAATHSIKYFRKSAGYKKEPRKKAWLSNHESMLLGSKRKLTNDGKVLSANNVISTVMFGFWVSFFEDAYAGIDPNKSLWPHQESKVFLPGGVANRKQAHLLLLDLQRLRNRMSHHEPVWKDKSVVDDKSAIQFLHTQVDNALLLIRSFSTERYEHLLKSGKVAFFKGVCSERTLLAYLRGDQFKRLDKRKVKRLVCREMRNVRVEPVILTVHDVPKFVVDLWPNQ
ncbi:Abi family protein [Vibrio aestuarianus]|uniref:Abi family protein n=1 Tax=Vibrio aestuarianus TaxID=28171 RepID=A0AAX3U3A5_9VIBR|nr:Abi family protein [Vibrio aestuarianus]WGK81959.1 Abi family protein [Vibrio aestuarianus]